jgi:hypothetical protein
MRHSKLFSSKLNVEIEKSACKLLNTKKSEFSSAATKSPRAVGDIAQDVLAENFAEIAPKGLIAEYRKDFGRRDMEDFAFKDEGGFYYAVDVKTHRKSTTFNRPNLTSVKKLADLYEDDKKYFVVMMLAYDVSRNNIHFDHVNFVPIEFLQWNCLTLGALGKGQIQIADSNKLSITPMYSRRAWMIELCDRLLAFYPREIEKIGKRVSHFEVVKASWEARRE